MHILYVEDNDLSREIMQMVIEDYEGYELTMLDDSNNFNARVKALPQADIVLLDIHVQPLDGFEMLQVLREMDQYKNIPIVALTASVMNEEVAKLRTVGFNGAIAKPIDQNTFEEYLSQILGGKEVWSIINHI